MGVSDDHAVEQMVAQVGVDGMGDVSTAGHIEVARTYFGQSRDLFVGQHGVVATERTDELEVGR